MAFRLGRGRLELARAGEQTTLLALCCYRQRWGEAGIPKSLLRWRGWGFMPGWCSWWPRGPRGSLGRRRKGTASPEESGNHFL